MAVINIAFSSEEKPEAVSHQTIPTWGSDSGRQQPGKVELGIKKGLRNFLGGCAPFRWSLRETEARLVADWGPGENEPMRSHEAKSCEEQLKEQRGFNPDKNCMLGSKKSVFPIFKHWKSHHGGRCSPEGVAQI